MADRFLYFAYGSNMLTRRLRSPDRAPSAQRVASGYLTGHRLAFDKESEDKEGRRSGKCDIAVTGVASDCVWGVLFSVEVPERDALDTAEGARGKNPGYKRIDVAVMADNGTRHTAVTTYMALRNDPDLCPDHWYKAFVVAGAVEHRLPFSYVEWLRTFESQPDPDAERRIQNEALLFQADTPYGRDVRG